MFELNRESPFEAIRNSCHSRYPTATFINDAGDRLLQKSPALQHQQLLQDLIKDKDLVSKRLEDERDAHLKTQDKLHLLHQETLENNQKNNRYISQQESTIRELKYDLERFKKQCFDLEDRLDSQKAVKESLRQKALESERMYQDLMDKKN
jgi:antitoxin component HigA of HigAB toxin-antitoxin module